MSEQKTPKTILNAVDAVEFRRKDYELTCAQWAQVLGMSRSHYSEFRNGKRPLPRHAMSAAYAYGVPADALFGCRPDKHIMHIRKALKP